MLAPRIDDRRPFAVALVALVGSAWLALLLWGISPYSRFLSHDAISDSGARISWEYAGTALIFITAWALMTVAMMLPTALPLVLLFRRFVGNRHEAAALVLLLVVGYLGVWILFGSAAHLGDLALHAAVQRSHWLQDRLWYFGAAPLLLAGVYQVTPLKYLCLDKCRSPFSFIVEHWHGHNERREAFRLGLHHGLFCVGCCWSLMLVMFAVGVGNLGWMLGLAIVMAMEKNLSWGRRLGAPLGIGLIIAGLALAIFHGVPTACAHDGSPC